MTAPVQIARRLARIYADRYRALIPQIVDLCVTDWNRNGRVGHRPLRADASDHVTSALAGVVRLVADHPPDPAKVQAAGEAVDRKNATAQRLPGIPTRNIANGAEVTAFRDRNLSLIKTLDANAVDRLREVLGQAEIEAWRVEQLRTALTEELEITKRHAEFIARDQVLKLNGQLTQLRQTSNGIDRYEWSTSNDERVRPDHADLDGTVQLWLVPPITNEKTGARNHPGQDYQCRCQAIPILE